MLDTREAAMMEANDFQDSLGALPSLEKWDIPLTITHSIFTSWAALNSPINWTTKTKQNKNDKWIFSGLRGLRFPPEGGGGDSLFKPYRYGPPHRVGFLHCFGLKTGIHFAHFGRERRSVWTYFNSRWVRKKEKIKNGFEKFFCLHSNLSDDSIISA